MSDVGLNYEIWTPPSSGDFKRKWDVTPWVMPGTNLDLRLVDLSAGLLRIHLSCPHLAGILTSDSADHTNDVGSTLMVFRDGTWIAAAIPVRGRVKITAENEAWVDYQLEGLEWYFDRARIKAFDYPADPIREGDWLYGAASILKAAGAEVSDAQWFLDVTGATTGNYQITDGVDNTANIAWNESDPATIKTRLETDLASINTVAVSGSGTPADPFLIILTDPSGTNATLSVDADTTDGTVELDLTRAGGTPSPRPWHGGFNAVTGQTIGNYQTFQMVEAGVGAVPSAPSSTHLLELNVGEPDAAGDYGSAQVEAVTVPGHRFRAGIYVRADEATTVRLVMRTLNEDYADDDSYVEQALTADTWTWLSIPEFTPDVDVVVYRLGVIDAGDAATIWLDVNEALLAPGAEEANLGEISGDLLPVIQARGVLDWLVATYSDTLDSSGQAWDRDLFQGLRKGQTWMHFLEYEARWGYERSIRYDPANPTATPFDFGLFNPGNRDDAPTGVSVSAIDGMIDAAPVESAAPDFTTAIAEGAEGRWGESTDADLETGWGKLEGYYANRQGRASDNLDALAAQEVAYSARETRSYGAAVQDPAWLFGEHLVLGDTIPLAVHDADGSITPRLERLVGVVIEETDTLPIYRYSFGAVVFDADAAQADALRTLIRRYQALDDLGPAGTLEPLSTTGQASQVVGPGGSIRATARSLEESDTTSHQVTLPTGIEEGDQIVVVFHATDLGQNTIDVTDWDGFLELTEVTDIEPLGGEDGWTAYKQADGSEGGTTLTITTDVSSTSATLVVVVADATGVPEATSTKGGSSTNPDPPAETHSAGGRSFLTIAAYSTDGPNGSPTASRQTDGYPIGFAPLPTVGSVIGSSDGGTIGAAYRRSNSPTADPSPFSFTGNADQWAAHTIVVPTRGGVDCCQDRAAIHDDVAGEIAALTLVTAANGDHVLIEDASDSNNKKRVAASDFLSGGGDGPLLYSAIGDGSANRTTTSTSMTDLTDMSVTFAATAGDVLKIHFACTATNSNVNANVHFLALVGSSEAPPGFASVTQSGNFAEHVSLLAVYTVQSGDISGGTVTVKIQWKVASGTGTINNNSTAGDQRRPVLTVENFG